MFFKSQTYGTVSHDEIPFKLNEFYQKNKHYGTPFNIIVGTDSQNHKDTKVVTVVAITCEGHGGIYFYRTQKIRRIDNVVEKLYYETGDSITVASTIMAVFMNYEELEELYMNSNFAIHVDAGTNPRGKTHVLIKELAGWITASGFEYEIKPNSFVASSIADKISK